MARAPTNPTHTLHRGTSCSAGRAAHRPTHAPEGERACHAVSPAHWQEVKLEDEERRQIENFRVRDARCARPAERMRLLEAVRAEHGSEERFDAWFRQAMPRIVLEGKRRHMRRARHAIARAFDELFSSAG